MERPVFSDMLSVRRRELGYSIRQASRVLRLREDVLIAFEEGDFEQMPKSGYAQGMLSSYSRYLGLDAGEVVKAFTRDLERYNREMRHHRRESDKNPVGISGGRPTGENVGQPYVRSRGLLPTSGGPAGDLGSFSTTRVRPRSFGTTIETDDDYVSEHRAHTGYEVDTQSRPYTARTPRVTSRTSSTWDATQIRTQPVDLYGYEDDLKISNNARRFESASSDIGRRSSRHISDASRPRVQRRGDQAGSRRTSRRDTRPSSPFEGGNLLLVGIVAAVVVLTVTIVLSVSSCVRQGTEARTVPVSAAIEAERERQGQDASTETTDDGTQTDAALTTDEGETPEDERAASSSKKSDETSVSVSVADGAVTWLEVNCDGTSDVAATVTGPWQRTYTVTESITVQAGNTTAVSVVQNGRQVQFDSIASGIGTLRIEGSGKKRTTASTTGPSSGTSSTSTSESQTSQNRIGNQSGANAADGSDATAHVQQDTADSASESSDTGSVQDSGYGDESGYTNYDTDDSDYSDYGDYGDSGYGYDESGSGYDSEYYGYDETEESYY